MDNRRNHAQWGTLPLADSSIFAVTGFRSLIPGSNRFSEHLHAAYSAMQAMAMTEKAYAAMWGGSMALRRSAFERYAVYDKWSTAMVDGMSLTWIIRKHHLQRIFSPDCVVGSRETYMVRFRWFLYAPSLLVLGTCCGWIGFFPNACDGPTSFTISTEGAKFLQWIEWFRLKS